MCFDRFSGFSGPVTVSLGRETRATFIRPSDFGHLSAVGFFYQAVSSQIDIKYVAHLARLALSPEEEQEFGAQLADVLGYIEKLKEVDVTGVEPTAHAVPLINVTRPDETAPCMNHEEALRNAPAHANGLFVVPKIVE